MFKQIHAPFMKSKNKMAWALHFKIPLAGSSYVFRAGLARDQQSDIDDLADYSRRVDNLRRSIELSAIA